jgi:hypothetical protein
MRDRSGKLTGPQKGTPRKLKRSSRKQLKRRTNKRDTADKATASGPRVATGAHVETEAQLPLVPPPEALASQAAFQAWLKSLPPPPQSFYIGEDLNWKAPWVEIMLRVELPFWLMVDNATVSVNVGGHEFPVSLHGESFELHMGQITDSKEFVVYQGPIRKDENLSAPIKALLRKRPKPQILWRKCKTVLKITSRCNEDVWNKRTSGKPFRPSVALYLQGLCGAHIPVINKLIQGYRLATYDHFAFEVAPWDVPCWYVEWVGHSALCLLVPYRGWDHKPMSLAGPDGRRQFYQLIDAPQLRERMSEIATPGELELLDAINLMERGNYSDAVRRITTAIEVVVEAVTGDLVERHEGKQASLKFLKKTKTNFPRRVAKYGDLGGRPLRDALSKELTRTRNLRHQIVHNGYRISPGERGSAQRSVDTGRWIFNWFENNEQRRKVRDTRLAYRSMGRDQLYNIFRPEITPQGVALSSIRDQLKDRA